MERMRRLGRLGRLGRQDHTGHLPQGRVDRAEASATEQA
jgi:hypothetical protein